MLTLLSIFCGTEASAGHHLYVSTTGNDKARGTLQAPLRTLEAALQKARKTAGRDTLYIHVAPGTYFLSAPLQVANDFRCPIVIEGDGTEKPILSGGYAVKGWKKAEGGLWTCKVDEIAKGERPFEQFYVNGRIAPRASMPDGDYLHLRTAVETRTAPGKTRVEVFVNPDSLSELRLLADQLGSAVLAAYHNWDFTRRKIDNIDFNRGIITFHGDSMAIHNRLSMTSLVRIENFRGGITSPGEWYLETDGTLYYMPLPGERMETAECIAPRLEQLVVIEGTAKRPVNGVVMRNLSFRNAANYMPAKGVTDGQGAPDLHAVIMAKYANGIVIDGCEVTLCGNYGAWLREGCHNSAITRSNFHDLGGGGIKIGANYTAENASSHVIVDNNIIQRLGRTVASASGIMIFYAADCKVTHNDIGDLFYSGISVGWCWGYWENPTKRNEIGYNHIHHVGWGVLSDLAGIYTLGPQPGARLHHNVIHDVISYDYGGWGIYPDAGSSDILIDRNLVYGTKCGGFHQNFGRDNIVTNNIFAWGILQQLQKTVAEEHRAFTFTHNIIYGNNARMMLGKWLQLNADMDYNCYWSPADGASVFPNGSFKDWQKLHDQHSIEADPHFVNAAQGDFRLRDEQTVSKIGFEPFDYSNAGVYGSAEWKKLAETPQETVERFRQVARQSSMPSYYK